MDGFLEEIIVRRELADNFCFVSTCRKQPCRPMTYTVLMALAFLACSM